ncbi:MAG: LysR family transcriptional regulator [Clostridia bacterium]|nr:LysR family transcriptional regulator [Clostridia bacterium]
MDIELRDMRYFVRVIDEGSFTRAAEKLFITQPALSRKIGELEEHLGVRLLERTTRRVSLSDAGRVFDRYARRMLADCDALGAELERIRCGAQGTLRIGYGTAGQFDYVTHLIAAMERRYPGIVVDTECGDELEPLYDGRVDAALFMACEAKGHDWLQSVALEEAGLSAFLPADSGLAEKDGAVSLADMRDMHFVLPIPRNISERIPCATLHETIREELIAAGISPEHIGVAHGPRAFSVSVAKRQAIGIMPDSSRAIANGMVVCRPIAECRRGYEVVVACRKDCLHRPAVRALMEIAASDWRMA